ncbi:Selenoprotein S (SelS) [Nesidiocoris tenuis]|uniref:Selenoprotein S (SelS) n=1 Tax=Nesidiocoris tenuis TaxID=355587 RepID=A0ABN7B248_9HEMI|nr:Selenoprotein S (SelS) [Nesidiocoris tenuis]
MDVLQNVSTNVFDFLVDYRWYLFGLVLLFGAFRHRIYAYYRQYKRRQDEYEYAAKYHKNSDLGKQRLDAVTMAREKMQRELEAKAAEAERIRLEKKAEAKARQEAGQDGKGGSTSSGSRLRAEHFPLMGHSGGSNYRAPKKSCCKKGGGCG